MTKDTARDVALALDAYLKIEKGIVEHKDDKDPAKLIAYVEMWAAMAEEIAVLRQRVKREVLTGIVAQFGTDDA